MRFLGYPILLMVLGLFVAGVMAVLGMVSGASSAAGEPGNFALAFNFGGPRTVLFCWSQQDAKDVSSYDMRVTHWNFGRTRTEIFHGVATATCAGSTAAARLFDTDNLYHVAVRACRNSRCSDWVDTTGPEGYWFQIPCAEPSGKGCLYQDSDQPATSRTR